jgi:hypothetical protein
MLVVAYNGRLYQDKAVVAELREEGGKTGV